MTKIYKRDQKTGRLRRTPWHEVETIFRIIGEQGQFWDFVRQYGAVWDEAPSLPDPRFVWTSTPEGIVAPPYFSATLEDPDRVEKADGTQAHAKREAAEQEQAARAGRDEAGRDEARRATREQGERTAREKPTREQTAKVSRGRGLPPWTVLPVLVALIVLAVLAGRWGDALHTWLKDAASPPVGAAQPVLMQSATVLNDRVALRGQPSKSGEPAQIVNSRDVVTVSCAQIGERVIVAAEARVGEGDIRDEVPDWARVDNSDLWLRTGNGTFVAVVYVSLSPAPAAIPDCLGGPDRRVIR